MTIYDIVKQYLEVEPRARARETRDRAMINLLLKKYPLDVPKETLIAFAQDFESYTRIWRKILQDCPELRTESYEDKEVLEQEKMLSLGYESGYQQDLKLSKKL